MKSNKRLTALLASLMAISLAIAQGGSNRSQLRDSRSIALPAYAVLDENAAPLVSSNGKVGFIASVTGGSLISFSLTSGRIISSAAVGETVGQISMVEANGHRLIAVPAANQPDSDQPATVSVIDATSARQMDLHAILVLPAGAHITPATRPLLTRDGRYCVIASSFNEPTLFVFSVETGEIVSQLSLGGRPAEIALYDKGRRRLIAVASPTANALSIIRLTEDGGLGLIANFNPAATKFDQANNPAFSDDGRTVYIASADGDTLFAIDTGSGAETESISVSNPGRIIVASGPDESALIGVTRLGQSSSGTAAGVTILTSRDGRLTIKSEFTPPEQIEMSRANNVELDADASLGFIGSATGILFVFDIETGELEAFQNIGKELRAIALNTKTRTVAAVRSGPAGDEIAVVGFDLATPDTPERPGPVIRSISPDSVEQGRPKSLDIAVAGEGFGESASLIVNGVQFPARFSKRTNTLNAKLPAPFFAGSSDIAVQVRGVDGATSSPALLRLTRPDGPAIDRIKPSEVRGPASPFTMTVAGRNFRGSSIVYVAGQPLTVERISDKELRVRVPKEVAEILGHHAVQVVDLAVQGLVSNEVRLTISAPASTAAKLPVIDELRTSGDIVAGEGSFRLRIKGNRFRSGATVEINGQPVNPIRVHRIDSGYINVQVPRGLTEDAGKLFIVVRNPPAPGGLASNQAELEVHAPEISGFDPGQIIAGVTKARLNIHGSNFRKGVRVGILDPNGASSESFVKLGKNRVRFRSATTIVVAFNDQQSELLAQPKSLKLKVVNPNNGDGVDSAESEIKIVGPKIDEALTTIYRHDSARRKMVITGEFFRGHAAIEFLQAGTRFGGLHTPTSLSANSMSLIIRAKKLPPGDFDVRVINPAGAPDQEGVPSNPVRVERGPEDRSVGAKR